MAASKREVSVKGVHCIYQSSNAAIQNLGKMIEIILKGFIF